MLKSKSDIKHFSRSILMSETWWDCLTVMFVCDEFGPEQRTLVLPADPGGWSNRRHPGVSSIRSTKISLWPSWDSLFYWFGSDFQCNHTLCCLFVEWAIVQWEEQTQDNFHLQTNLLSTYICIQLAWRGSPVHITWYRGPLFPCPTCLVLHVSNMMLRL